MNLSPQILLVDGDPDEVRLVREVVESAGLEMHVRSDRASVMEAFRTIEPDLVLIGLEGEEAGGETVKGEIMGTDKGRTIPIVLIGGGAAAPAAALSQETGERLMKPLRAQALLGVLARHFPHAFLPAPPGAQGSAMGSIEGVAGFPLDSQPGGFDQDFPGFEPFGEEALGELLDTVFPASDSGSLASTLTSAREASAAAPPTPPAPPAPPAPPTMTAGSPDPIPAAPLSPPSPLFPPSSASPPEPAPVPRPVDGVKVARGDFLPNQIQRPEEPPQLAVQPPADAIGPRDEAAGQRLARRPIDSSMHARTRLRSGRRGSSKWLIATALVGILLAAGSIALIEYWNSDSDLRPVIEPAHRAHRAGALSAGPAPQAAPAAPSTAEPNPSPAAPREGEAASVPPLATAPAAEAAPGEGQAGLALEKRSHQRPHESAPPRKNGLPVPRAGGSAAKRESARKTEPGAGSPSEGTTAPAASAPAAVHGASGGGAIVPEGVASAGTERPPSIAGADARQTASAEAGAVPPSPSAPAAAPLPAGGSASAPAGNTTSAPAGSARQAGLPGSVPSPDGSVPAPAGSTSAPPPAAPAEAGQTQALAPAELHPPSESTPPAALGQTTRTDQPFVSPVALDHPQPKYPSAARARKLAGTVKLLVKVGEDGSVMSVRVVGPVAPVLDQAAVHAVFEWKYRPGQFGDRIVSAWVEESVTFKP